MKKSVLLFLLLFSMVSLSAQETDFLPQAGVRGGLTFNFGSKVNRLGLFAGGFYARDFVQLNSSVRVFYNFNTFGPRKPRPELQLSCGLVVSYGGRDTLANYFYHGVSNQTGRRNSLGYAYHWYFEKLARQATGTLGLQFGHFEIITENDALAGQGQDKFRTGALQLAWRQEHSRWVINSILWTGNTHGDKVCRIQETGEYHCRFGYKDLSQAHCGRFSHGIAALQYQRHLGYGQTIAVSSGVDSEYVRQILQNKLIHDLVFLPKAWVKPVNPHYPMLDTEGLPFLDKNKQCLRPGRFYFDVGGNAGLFY